jgi:hypothetical protein
LWDVKFASRLLVTYVSVVLSCGESAVTQSTPREEPASYPDYPIVTVPPGADASVDAGTHVEPDGS